MACKEYEGRLDLLEDYAGASDPSELSAGEKEQVRAHLETCAACQEEVEAVRAAGKLLRAAFAPTGEPGATFWFHVRAGIRTAADQGVSDFWGSLEWIARRLAWTVALVLMLLAGYATLTHQAVDAQGEVREIFPELAQPTNQEEVLQTLARNGK